MSNFVDTIGIYSYKEALFDIIFRETGLSIVEFRKTSRKLLE